MSRSFIDATHPEPVRDLPTTTPTPQHGLLRDGKIHCALCSFSGKMLRRHILACHGLQPADYLNQVGLPAYFPMTTPEYSKARSKLAIENGLGHNRKRWSARSKA